MIEIVRIKVLKPQGGAYLVMNGFNVKSVFKNMIELDNYRHTLQEVFEKRYKDCDVHFDTKNV